MVGFQWVEVSIGAQPRLVLVAVLGARAIFRAVGRPRPSSRGRRAWRRALDCSVAKQFSVDLARRNNAVASIHRAVVRSTRPTVGRGRPTASPRSSSPRSSITARDECRSPGLRHDHDGDGGVTDDRGFQFAQATGGVEHDGVAVDPGRVANDFAFDVVSGDQFGFHVHPG